MVLAMDRRTGVHSLQFVKHQQSFECWHVLLQRISAYDTIINAVSYINPDLISEAAQMDLELQSYKASGQPLPYLFCVPIIFKVHSSPKLLCKHLRL